MTYRIQNIIYSTLKEAINASNVIDLKNREKGIFKKDHEDSTIHEYIEPLSIEQEYINK